MIVCHPDADLTMRQFFDKFYDQSDLEESSKKRFHCELLRWERLTSNPPISEITNELVATWRERMCEKEYSPQTTNSTWTDLRAILRVACKEDRFNPRGRGIIDSCPYMKPLKEVRGRPRRVSLHELGDVYLSCEKASAPRHLGFPSGDWWRAFIVLAYFTGLRKGDRLALKRSQFDLREGRFTFIASKTKKEDTYPLHELVILHLEKIWYPEREQLFEGMLKLGGRFYSVWKKIVESSGVTQYFSPHDIRRTSASEIQRVKPGMAGVFLQHAATDVTSQFYLNQELAECIDAMRFPEQFATGAAAKLPEPLKPRRAAVPNPVDPRDWKFWPGGFTYFGERYSLPGGFPQMLELLVNAGGPLTWQQLYEGGVGRRLDRSKAPARIKQSVCQLRRHLRECLGLPESVDPVRCTQRGQGGAYILYVPPRATIHTPEQHATGGDDDGE